MKKKAAPAKAKLAVRDCPLRFVLVGDTHHDLKWWDETSAATKRAYELASELQADLIDLGDTVHSRSGRLEVSFVARFHGLYQELSEMQVNSYFLTGNHGRGDLETNDNAARILAGLPNFQYFDRPDHFVLEDEEGNRAGLFFVPYMEKRDEFIEVVRRLAEDATALAADAVPCVLFTHQAYRGGVVGPDEPGYAPTLEDFWELPGDLFEPWATVFSAHFHKHQTLKIGGRELVYLGAPIQHNFGDRGQVRGVVSLGIGPQGVVWEHVPFEGFPTYETISITSREQLEDLKKQDLSNTYVKLVVADSNLTEEDLEGIQCLGRAPTDWKAMTVEEARLQITEETSPLEILLGWLKYRFPDLEEEAVDALVERGLAFYQAAAELAAQEEGRIAGVGKIQFLYMELEEFGPYRKVRLEFDKPGATVIWGENGHGKSHLFYGLIWTLFNYIEEGPADSVINEVSGKGTLGTVAFQAGSETFIVKRGRKHKDIKGLSLTKFLGDAVRINLTTGDRTPATVITDLTVAKNDEATQDKLNSILGLDRKAFQRLVAIQDIVSFASLTPAEKHSYLSKLVTRPEWAFAYQGVLEAVRVATEALRKAEEAFSRAQGDYARTKANLTELKGRRDAFASTLEKDKAEVQASIAHLEKFVTTGNPSQEKIDAIQNEIVHDEAALEELVFDQEAYDKQVELKAKIEGTVTEASRAEIQLRGQLHNLREKLKTGVKQRKLTAGAQCPTCGQTISEKHVAACQKEYEAQLKELADGIKKEITEAEEALKKEKARIAKYTPHAEQVRVKIQELREIQKQRTLLENGIKHKWGQVEVHKKAGSELETKIRQARGRITALQEQLEGLEAKDNPFIEMVTNEEAELFQLGTTLQETEGEVNTLKADGNILDTLKLAFSPKGIPNFELEGALPGLTQHTNEYLKDLSSGNISITLSAQRETGKGTMSEEIHMEVLNLTGTKIFVRNSRGEKRQIDLAFAMGSNDYFRSRNHRGTNLFLLDEVADPLDAKRCEAMAQVLKRKAKDHAVFLITHNDALYNQFEHRLRVRKIQKGLSVLEAK